MEWSSSSNNQRNPKFKRINNNMVPLTLNAEMDAQFTINRCLLDQSRSPLFDPYSSENLDSLDPTLLKYFHTPPGIIHSAGYKYSKNISFLSRGLSSLSPLSSLENLDFSSRSMSPPLFSTSSKGDDDVLVIDGISVGSVPGERIRMAIEPGGSSSSSVLPLGINFYKSEMCRSGENSGSSWNNYKSELCWNWEGSGGCPYGPKCRYAHGKEDLRPTRSTPKNKFEMPLCNSYVTGSICKYGTNCKFLHPPTNTPDSTPANVHIASPVTVDELQTSIDSRNWSPQDDNIEVTLPSSTAKPPSREDVDAYIDDSTGKKRLSAFTRFCPTTSHPK